MTDEWAWRQIAATIGLLVLGGILVGLGFVYSGLYNVAADKESGALKKWLLHTTMEKSVEARLDEVPNPPDLKNRELLAVGAEHYDAMCADCHGAPGGEPADLVEGLNPPPPDLVEEGPEEDPKEMFWITKHGIEMTGMPAWGPTHDDRNLWGVVGVMKQFDDMTEEEYRRLIEEAAATGHHHGGGGTPHGDESSTGPHQGDSATERHDAGDRREAGSGDRPPDEADGGQESDASGGHPGESEHSDHAHDD